MGGWGSGGGRGRAFDSHPPPCPWPLAPTASAGAARGGPAAGGRQWPACRPEPEGQHHQGEPGQPWALAATARQQPAPLPAHTCARSAAHRAGQACSPVALLPSKRCAILLRNSCYVRMSAAAAETASWFVLQLRLLDRLAGTTAAADAFAATLAQWQEAQAQVGGRACSARPSCSRLARPASSQAC